MKIFWFIFLFSLTLLILVSTNDNKSDKPFIPSPPPIVNPNPPPIPKPIPQPEPPPKPIPPPPKPGDNVKWLNFPAQRSNQGNHTPFLEDILTHLPYSMGNQYFANDSITWGHETTHGINSHIRNTFGKGKQNGFYVGGNKAIVLNEPNVTLSQVASMIPYNLRGSRYNLYFIQQQRDWNNSPLYVFDEFVAYVNGSVIGLERHNKWSSDDMVACLEFSNYAICLARTIERYDPTYFEREPQFKEFLAYMLRVALSTYQKGIILPEFQWDRTLEQQMRNSQEIKEILRNLYGSNLGLNDLLLSYTNQ